MRDTRIPLFSGLLLLLLVGVAIAVALTRPDPSRDNTPRVGDLNTDAFDTAPLDGQGSGDSSRGRNTPITG